VRNMCFRLSFFQRRRLTAMGERYWISGVQLGMFNPKENSTCREICSLRGLCKIQFERNKKKEGEKSE